MFSSLYLAILETSVYTCLSTEESSDMSRFSVLGGARFTLLMLVVLALSIPMGWAATIQGSSSTSRSFVDLSAGQVYIYNGGFFASGEQVTTFSWFGHLFSGSKNMTPILFEETSTGVFTVRGIGTGQTVTDSGASQSFAFGLTSGTDTTSNAFFTFGFINAMANTSGTTSSATAGTVDFDLTVDAGTGVGGGGTTNDWVFTPGSTSVTSIALGTTFFTPGHEGTVALNDPTKGGSNVDRTYSANLDGAIIVAEPGSFLLVGAGLVLAGLFRYSRVRSRQPR